MKKHSNPLLRYLYCRLSPRGIENKRPLIWRPTGPSFEALSISVPSSSIPGFIKELKPTDLAMMPKQGGGRANTVKFKWCSLKSHFSNRISTNMVVRADSLPIHFHPTPYSSLETWTPLEHCLGHRGTGSLHRQYFLLGESVILQWREQVRSVQTWEDEQRCIKYSAGTAREGERQYSCHPEHTERNINVFSSPIKRLYNADSIGIMHTQSRMSENLCRHLIHSLMGSFRDAPIDWPRIIIRPLFILNV